MRFVLRIVTTITGVCIALGAVGVGQAAAVGLSTVHSTSFAGYQAYDPTPITTFSGTLTMPTFTCPPTGSFNFSAEVSLNSPAGQDGGMNWNTSCYNGTSQGSSASVYVLDAAAQLVGAEVGIAPGQSVQAAITPNTLTGRTTVTIKNLTTSANAKGSTPNLVSFNGVFAALSDGNYSGTGMAIPSFTKATFGKLLFNGATLATLSPTRYDLYDGTTLQVATTPISASGTFSTVFKHT